jgi:uncharacterized protein
LLAASHTTILPSLLRPAFFRTVQSSVLAGLTLVWVDAQVREGWPFIPTGQHWRWSLLLYTAAGALLGVLAQLPLWAEHQWSGKRPLAVRAAFYAALGASLLAHVAIWTFSGEGVSGSRLGLLGPLAFLVVGASAAGAAGALMLFAAKRVRRGDHLLGGIFALGLGALGLQIARVDLTQYVALYTRMHTLLEAAAWLALACGYWLLLTVAEARLPQAAAVVGVLGSFSLAVLLGVAVSGTVRTGLEGGLRHVFLEEVYVGRMLRRLQLAEAFADDPRGFRSLSWSRLQGLRKRYGLRHVTESPEWKAPPVPLAAEQQSELWSLRDPLRRYNVIVYYVDTLRADVTRDQTTMPNVAAFAAGAVHFPHAYSAGSDTLRALPALTGGDYDVLSTPKNDVLRLARRAGYESTLLIPRSAQAFLAKLRPEFRFDRTLAIADHPESQEVWGYGADQPTSGLIVDRALEYLDEPRRKRQPFLLWLFNFDLHNWRELSAPHVDVAMRRHRIEDDPTKLPYRYRAVAASVDDEFGRLVRELDRRKLFENTVIVFVSDHGEALGREGFWVHSVFLWESLVRVPLIVKAPGLPARRVEERVSLVDVAPTLARYMLSNPDMTGYAGEDLLTRLLARPPRRRLPVLLMSASKDVLVRVGMIDPGSDYKLVLSLEAALPELYDLRADDPDASNVADKHPALSERLLRRLVASPVFPRSLWDFDVRDTKEQRAAVGIPAEP